MKSVGLMLMGVTAAVFTALPLLAAEGDGDWLTVRNRIRIEYDDNIYETERNKQDSVKFIEELELHLNASLNQTYISLRYRPSFIYWSDRNPDDTDLHHDLDLVLNHEFSPRARIALKNTLRLAELPELIDRGTTLRQNDDYLYNVSDANLEYSLRPKTFLRVGGRYTLLEYDDADVAATENYDIAAGGVTLGQKLSGDTILNADFRVEQTDYDGPDRGSDSLYYGLGLEQTLNPAFVATIRAGIQDKEFNDSALGSEDQPYFDLVLTYLPSPDTRISLGTGYSMFEADVFPFASQDRLLFFGNIAHDLTARVTLYLAGSYQMSDYSADQAVENDRVEVLSDGSEEAFQASTRASYQVNKSNWLELSYQLISLNGDLREDFDRNRVSVGWRVEL